MSGRTDNEHTNSISERNSLVTGATRSLSYFFMTYNIPLLEFTEEYRYSAALHIYLYVFCG